MKVAIVIGIIFWLICGVAGAWMLEGGDNMHFKSIAWGPFTLAEAFNERPVTYPGPD